MATSLQLGLSHKYCVLKWTLRLCKNVILAYIMFLLPTFVTKCAVLMLILQLGLSFQYRVKALVWCCENE